MLRALYLLLAMAVSRLGAEEPTVSMKIDMVAWGDDITGLSLQAEGADGQITAFAFRYSAAVAYSGPAVMEIYKSSGGSEIKAPAPSADDIAHQLMPLQEEPETATEDADKPKQGLALELEKRRKKAPTLVALAALPATGCRRATILLAPAGGGTFIAYILDDDPDNLPPGLLRLHNLSGIPIAMRWNKKVKKELNPRESLLVPIQNQQLTYELAYKLGDKWEMQEHNIIPVRKTEQTQMIVLKSDNSFFRSADGSSGGFLQIVTLRRGQSH